MQIKTDYKTCIAYIQDTDITYRRQYQQNLRPTCK